MQKDKLGQDIFLLGPPGPLRRNLIMKYAEMTQREYVEENRYRIEIFK
jgi:hypothetical protein